MATKKGGAKAPAPSESVPGAGWSSSAPIQPTGRGKRDVVDRPRYLAAVRTLRKRGLTMQNVRGLLRALAPAARRGGIAAPHSTIGEDREAIKRVATLFGELAAELDQLSTSGWAELDEASLAALGSPLGVHDLRRPMRALALATLERAEALPAQTRGGGTHPEIVEVVARFTGPLGIPVSKKARTAFHDACCAAYELADVVGDPTTTGKRGRVVDPKAAIEKYMAQSGLLRSPGAPRKPSQPPSPAEIASLQTGLAAWLKQPPEIS